MMLANIISLSSGGRQMGYVRRNKNFWLPVVKDWQQSGKSQSEYAKKHNISKYALSNWARQLKREFNEQKPYDANKISGFVEIDSCLQDEEEIKAPRSIKITTASGCTVEVPL